MTLSRRTVTVVVCLLAALSCGASGSSQEFPGTELNDESVTVANGTSDISSKSTNPGVLQANPPWSSSRKRRRVAFSHMDISADEFPQPILKSFKKHLPGREKDGVNSSSVHYRPRSLVDTQERVEGQQIANNEGRTLAITGSADDPSFYPSGGTYHHPVAVSVVTNDGSIIFYTTDGTPPDKSSKFITSGDLIVLDSSATVRAIASFGDSTFSGFSSAEVEASFVVYSAGKCGRAYFVPYFTSSGFSGNVVQVNLQTETLGSVRLHGVVTDFADFYSTGGLGPYDEQVATNDLTAEDNDGLAGYWGGFSGDVGGAALGFLSPFFNGKYFHGKAIQINLANFGRESMTRFCESGGVSESDSTCIFKVLDLEEIDPDLRGFSGGFLADSKAYFVPSQDGRGGGAKVVRVDASIFSSQSVEILDLRSVDPELGGFYGGFSWEGYGYLVPSRSFQGPVGGVNTNSSADGFEWTSSFLGDDSGHFRRKAGRLQPAYSGKLVRVDLTDFSSSGVQVLDLTMVDPDLRGFMGGFAVGHWGFMVPFKNKGADGEFSGKMVRFDLRTFDYAGVTVLDLTRVDRSLRGFVGGFAHGRYAILSPYTNGNTTGNYRSRSQFSKMVAVDLTDFTVEGVSVVDLAETSRQQIPYQPDPNLRGYVGGFSLGQHVYLTPHFNGVFFGKVVRVDMREILTMAAGKRATSYDGLQVLDLEMESSDAVGFSGVFHSRDTSCY